MAHHKIKTYADGHKQVPYCSVCSAEDTELPCDCPGEAMTQIQKRAVALGSVDFIGGKWMHANLSMQNVAE